MPDYHAWTHTPGGSDPIEFPASGGDLLWAMASASTAAVAQVSGTYYEFTFDSLYSNSSTDFEPADVTAHRARFMQINTPGYYILRALIFNVSGVFSNANDTWIDPTFDVVGSGIQALQVNLNVEDFRGSYWAANGRVNSGGPAWASLYTEAAFNWDPSAPGNDLNDQNPLKVGLTLAQAGGPSTISMAADVHVMRMADPGFFDLSPP